MRDIDDFKFTGPFSKEIPLYVQYKRSCGYKVAETDLYRLREMDRLFKEMGISEPVITREMYEVWTAVKPGERKVTSSRKRSILSSFGKYLISNGYQDVYVGHDDRRSFNSDYIPYVFSKEEISRMFALLDENCSKAPCYENEAFRAMMSMYYCCGFRKSEVVMLRLCDVDFQTGKVTVLDGKNRVSRIVLASDTLLSRMGSFCSKYHSHSSPDTFLFHGTKHKDKPFCRASLYKMYHSLLKNAGIPDREDGRVHRLHDVRHTFCVYALEQMQEKGFDTYTSLPLLSAYLGHKHIRETEYYLRLVEDRQENVLEKTGEYTPGLFPEIGEKTHG